MSDKLVTIEKILRTGESSSQKIDKSLIKSAYDFALETHGGNLKSGRMQHVLNVGLLMAKIGADKETIAAGIMHDTIFKGEVEKEKICEKFGEEITTIIEEATKGFAIEETNIGRLSPELLSTILLASAKDIRAIFVILGSAVDTLSREGLIDYRDEKEFARMALKVLSPICNKLELNTLKWMLEDSALKVLEPETYQKIKETIGEKRETREKEAKQIKREIRELLKKEKVEATVTARPKHFFAIQRKMNSGRTFESIKDLLGARIICDTPRQCYEILGIIHSNYKIIPEEFDDYIANPKKSRYKSLHTVIDHKGKQIEVQIRTWEMHWQNESGISAHWMYKGIVPNIYFDQKLSWAQRLVGWLRTKESSKKFLESLKFDFGENKVFVFTPKNQVIVLPEKSTTLDFAFAIHSDLGFRCKRTKVNGKPVTINHVLENGDIVEIIPGQAVQPKREWLNFVKSEKARTKIRQKLGIKTTVKKAPKKKQAIKTSSKSVRIAKCCNPLPGEEIIGVKTTKRKIIAHKIDCPNTKKITKTVPLSWDIGTGKDVTIQLKVIAKETPSLLPELLNAITTAGATIAYTSAKANKSNIVTANFKIKIKQAKQFENALRKMRSMPQVIEAERA
ncbi:MAG: bifunctional (p)ppGpp synthetase/guanosine-3',5'-bis(diphosphate) 3'-pyrophosphohydrolase [Candidatus Diapherotrites archaeon]|nr:bifunctional (p)ppGpp synthetase/guanosine-3',5'-bis(diphosphate) 3'-pyrophosphohydrolase [Candidatus Diapherotrites archaeon]